MKPRITLFVLALAGVICALLFFSRSQADIYEPKSTLKIGQEEISLIVRSTSATRTRGLSGTKHLADDSAMLFVFDEADEHGIWMKEMYFPIDIIWLDGNHKIITIEDNVSPDTYPTVFYPKDKSLYVLEVNAGFSERHALKTGDILQFTVKN